MLNILAIRNVPAEQLLIVLIVLVWEASLARHLRVAKGLLWYRCVVLMLLGGDIGKALGRLASLSHSSTRRHINGSEILPFII